jgi:NO-binding membrane sensor protein with MHYT domain
MSLAGEVIVVLCFMLAFWLLAGDGATNKRLILVAILCGCGVTAMLFLNAQAMVLQATKVWSETGIIVSAIIGAFSLVLPLLLFFRFQSHFRLTACTHTISALFLALMVLHIFSLTLKCIDYRLIIIVIDNGSGSGSDGVVII